jgi:hypothetical protein
MSAIKPILFLLAGLAVGAALALASLGLSVPTGWIGALALIGWAMLARRRWAKQEETSGLEPGAPERVLWLRQAGVAMILGHLSAAILLVWDGLRLGSGNSLATDVWTIVAAHQIAAFLFRGDFKARDERHAPIVAHGVRVGYATLVLTLVPLLCWLAFTPLPWRIRLTHFVLANVLIVLMFASHAAMLLAQQIAYARDTRAADAEPSVQ